MDPTPKSTILTALDIQSIITEYGLDNVMDNLIERMEQEIKSFHPDKIEIPARAGFNYNVPNIGLVEWMPLYQKGNKVTIKIVGYHPKNPSKFSLPTIISSISQYDTQTGHLLGIADGVLMTALRTGAASAIATKYLANPSSKTLGLIGCGAQSVTQLHAISRCLDIENVLYFDKDPETASTFENRVSWLNLNAVFEYLPLEEIPARSDVLCTATSIEIDEGPLFENIKAQPHLHINAVGSDFPGKVELPMDVINASFLCADFIDQALIEGECQRISRERIDTDLSTLLAFPEKFDYVKNKLSVFDSTGWALEDHICMNIFLEYASNLGIGKEVELEFLPGNSKSPYHFMTELVAVRND